MYFFFIKYCDFLVVAWRLVGVKWEKLLNLTKKKREKESKEGMILKYREQRAIDS